MRGGTKSQGYTIVEVLIFMAVSGLMFVMAAAFISGKQAKVEFKQGMNEANNVVRTVVNDVNNGVYSSLPASSTCYTGYAAGPPAARSGAYVPSGNIRCVMIGKVLQFGTPYDAAGESRYRVYSMAGRQYAPGTNNSPTTFGESLPRVLLNDQDAGTLFRWGIKVTKATSNGAGISGVGFFQSFAGYSSGDTLKSGSQTVNLVPILGALDLSDSAMRGKLDGPLDSATPVANANIVVCTESGNGQYGKLTIGGGTGQRLETSIKIYETKPAGC